MFNSRNFTSLRPGRYEDASHRVVIIEGTPEMVEQTNADLSKRTVEKWTGRRMKADGHTVEGYMHYTSDGSEWGSRATSSVTDLAKAIEYFDSQRVA